MLTNEDKIYIAKNMLEWRCIEDGTWQEPKFVFPTHSKLPDFSDDDWTIILLKVLWKECDKTKFYIPNLCPYSLVLKSIFGISKDKTYSGTCITSQIVSAHRFVTQSK